MVLKGILCRNGILLLLVCAFCVCGTQFYLLFFVFGLIDALCHFGLELGHCAV